MRIFESILDDYGPEQIGSAARLRDVSVDDTGEFAQTYKELADVSSYAFRVRMDIVTSADN